MSSLVSFSIADIKKQTLPCSDSSRAGLREARNDTKRVLDVSLLNYLGAEIEGVSGWPLRSLMHSLTIFTPVAQIGGVLRILVL